MNKEKILEAARNNNSGKEFEAKVLTDSTAWGTAISMFVSAIFILSELIIKGSFNDSLLACCSIIVGVQTLIEGIKTPKTRLKITGVLLLVIALISIILFIARMVG